MAEKALLQRTVHSNSNTAPNRILFIKNQQLRFDWIWIKSANDWGYATKQA
jgi:hypothetical protein